MGTKALRGLAGWIILLLLGCTFASDKAGCGQEKAFGITLIVTPGTHGNKSGPVCVALSLPASLANATIVKLPVKRTNIPGYDGTAFYCQLTPPGIATEGIEPSQPGLVRRDLHLRLPDLGPGSILEMSGSASDIAKGSNPPAFAKYFSWKDTPGDHTDLRMERLVLRYMYRAYDSSSPQARDKTYKVFHHLFDPFGKRLVTNGGQTDDNIADPKKLLYPHHRGLMYAFNRITYDGNKKADTWHAQAGDTHQEHVKFLSTEVGSSLGRHRVLIDWHGPKNEVFAKEERELTVYYPTAGHTLVEFVSRLSTTGGPVKLDGDPQHAGFQFRAANAVAEKTAKQTYFLRPDGKGGLGETRNWDPKTRKGPVNLPWDAMSFVLDGKRYTVAYLNHPSNPGEQRYSERDYGRFGCYFEAEVTKDRPLVVRYRVWLQEGEMTVPQVQALSTAFVDPPRVTVK
jgi:hypothetical protein